MAASRQTVWVAAGGLEAPQELLVAAARALDLPPSLCLAAILGGGVFGDHCSPISDTTAVSAIASGCDLLEHVRTQLPYAVAAGVLALLMYLVAGIVMI